MKEFDFAYSIDDIIAVGAYDRQFASNRTAPSATSASLAKPLQLVMRSTTLAICMLAGRSLSATPVPVTNSVESIMLATNQAMLATTQSEQFKKLVRGLKVANEHNESIDGPYPHTEEDKLMFAFSDSPSMDPPVVETRKARVRVRAIKQAEPSFKDLGTYQTYEHDNLFE
ncbi:hypothetical protein [Hymenobacter sp. BT491]|uniref:hypothetical protein n=1 Tax=Hymenobacter sp. BT491 TaxID=2766779 RepID=UPI001653D8C5|nr:hypothetical protein [Hymenobacter sp. BT491]MBC6991671.1 hypothetical protein [Hymenobacter sp. BT491]